MNLPEFLQREPGTDFIRLTGHRIGLADVVRLYNEGNSAELIASHFPTLPLALVHKVLAFYLENYVAVDDYVTSDTDALRQLEEEHTRKSTAPSFAQLRQRFQSIRPSGS
jgi:uncharacterized protein (DUF433 family)